MSNKISFLLIIVLSAVGCVPEVSVRSDPSGLTLRYHASGIDTAAYTELLDGSFVVAESMDPQSLHRIDESSVVFLRLGYPNGQSKIYYYKTRTKISVDITNPVASEIAEKNFPSGERADVVSSFWPTELIWIGGALFVHGYAGGHMPEVKAQLSPEQVRSMASH